VSDTNRPPLPLGEGWGEGVTFSEPDLSKGKAIEQPQIKD